MVIIKDYSLDRKSNSEILYVKSFETVPCPYCSGVLMVSGSRNRQLVESDGFKVTLRIRVLQCDNCERTHRELPDVIIPYKRYSSEAIEEILTEEETETGLDEYPCEQRTAVRIKLWFYLLSSYFEATIYALQELYKIKLPLILPFYPLSAQPAGWLKHLVRTVVNSSRWRQTRSA